MNLLKDLVVKERIRDFLEGISSQIIDRKYTEETFELASNTLYKIFNKAESMSEEDANAYLTTCIGVYLLASFEKDDDKIIDISPK